MNKILPLVLGMCLSTLASANTLEVVIAGKSAKYSLVDLKKNLPVKTLEIDDPVYGKAKKFDAFALVDLLKHAGWDEKATTEEIVFTAKDGYAPNTTFEKIQKHKGYVAFQEHGTRLKFGKVKQGKAMVSPAPYYLVWEEGRALGEAVPWPYQMVKIEAVNFAQKYDQLYPVGKDKASEEYKGFALFKDQCLRCHSINLQGGDLGPELNVPQNVTEYWSRGTLLKFIADASSFRARSKMPSFKNLKSEELEHLFEYLEFMKDRKAKL
ncbi:MAG: cytochrome c family protein [Bacteriovoracia bacterium]